MVLPDDKGALDAMDNVPERYDGVYQRPRVHWLQKNLREDIEHRGQRHLVGAEQAEPLDWLNVRSVDV